MGLRWIERSGDEEMAVTARGSKWNHARGLEGDGRCRHPGERVTA